eukprot:gene11555-biopygen8542
MNISREELLTDAERRVTLRLIADAPPSLCLAMACDAHYPMDGGVAGDWSGRGHHARATGAARVGGVDVPGGMVGKSFRQRKSFR